MPDAKPRFVFSNGCTICRTKWSWHQTNDGQFWGVAYTSPMIGVRGDSGTEVEKKLFDAYRAFCIRASQN